MRSPGTLCFKVSIDLILASFAGARLCQQPLHRSHARWRGQLLIGEALIVALGQNNGGHLVSFDDVHRTAPQAVGNGRHATALDFSNGDSVVVHTNEIKVLKYRLMVPNKVLFSNWQLKVRGALATFYKTRNQA
jgi:hypothetical protein